MEKKIFSNNSDMSKTAYLNWRMDSYDDEENMSVMAEAYYLAAITMIESVLQNNNMHQADALIFPAIHAVNHMIELYLKSIIGRINRMNGDKSTRLKSHNIVNLIDEMKTKIIKQESDSKEVNDHIKPLMSYIAELQTHIQGNEKHLKMDFSRYPLESTAKEHFYVRQSKAIVIDLEFFHWKIREIRYVLMGLYMMVAN